MDMAELNLDKLLKEPDHPLARLEEDIWAALDRHAYARRLFRRVFAAQAVVLAAALIGSTVAGLRAVPAHCPGALDIFSARPSLAAATLLVERAP